MPGLTPLRLLLVEDMPDDGALVVRALRRAGFAVTHERVDTESTMRAALRAATWDVVVADYCLPAFSAPAALALLQHAGLDLPLIVVSGILDDETAVEAMKAGARDFVAKARLGRLGAAVARELGEAEDRRHRRAVESALAREQRLSHLLVEETDALVIGLDPGGRVLAFNRTAEAFTGVPHDEVIGRSWSEVVTPAGGPRGALTDVFDPRSPLPGGTGVRALTNGAGEDRLVAWRKTLLCGADDDGLVCVLLGTDISAADGARGTTAARDTADAADRAKDDFLAMVAHELRTPLAAILGYSALLRRPELAEGTRARAVETIERNVRIQARLIDDLLDISRIVAGKLRLHPEPTGVTAAVDGALDVIRPVAEAKRVTLVRAVGAEAVVLADPSRLQQVLWNLLGNAVKFTPAGGRVTIDADRDGAQAVIRVRDTGTGISADALPGIFELYRQGPGGVSRGGLGVGLAVVRQIVEMHGGTVAAASDGRDRGAVFTVRLPLVGPPAA